MASYVVKSRGLEQTLRDWITLISPLCGDPECSESYGAVRIHWPRPFVPVEGDPNWVQRPRGGMIRREPPFFRLRAGLFESLRMDQWQRIQWYYYCDNDFGNTIRLYDKAHFGFGHNESIYLETENHGRNGAYTDRVLVRGENLEHEQGGLKALLRGLFNTDCYSARCAPIQDQQPAEAPIPFFDRLRGMGRRTMNLNVEKFDMQHAYFQHESRNNMPNNDLKIADYLK